MAENKDALVVIDNQNDGALVVIDSDDDAPPLAPWLRTVSDQAEVADIIVIKDAGDDDDDDAWINDYGSSPLRVKREQKPKPSPGGGGGSSGGGSSGGRPAGGGPAGGGPAGGGPAGAAGAPGGGGGGAPGGGGGGAPLGPGAAAPAPAAAGLAAPPVVGGMPTAAEKTAHLLTLVAGDRDLQRMLWHIGITFKLLPHQPVAVRMVAGVPDDYPNIAANASLDGALLSTPAPTNRGGLLADVMGLGKTVEAICGAALRQAICASKNLRPLPVVIVSPNVSVLEQWESHLAIGGQHRLREQHLFYGPVV